MRLPECSNCLTMTLDLDQCIRKHAIGSCWGYAHPGPCMAHNTTAEWQWMREQMLRILALLIMCAVSFLVQGEPASAHEGRGVHVQLGSKSGTEITTVSALPANDNNCPSRHACCTMICPPCQLPLPAHRGDLASAPLSSSIVPTLRNDSLRSIILGRDPPVPRTQLL